MWIVPETLTVLFLWLRTGPCGAGCPLCDISQGMHRSLITYQSTRGSLLDDTVLFCLQYSLYYRAIYRCFFPHLFCSQSGFCHNFSIEFCHNLSCWVLSQLKSMVFSQLDYLVFHNFSFWVFSQFEFWILSQFFFFHQLVLLPISFVKFFLVKKVVKWKEGG